MEQEARLEWRNFFYSHAPDEEYVRTTFDICLNYKLDKISLASWSLQTGYVWYFLKDPAYGERYADSREFRFLINKTFSNSRLSFGYKRERFHTLDTRPYSEAHTIEITYLFL